MEKFYLISGNETYDKTELLERIKKEFGTIEEGINYIVLEKNNIDSLEIEANTIPFGYPKKLIVVKLDNKAEKEEEKETDNSVQSRLLSLLEQMNEMVCVVLFGEFSSKSKLYQFVEKNGKCFVLDQKKENELVSWCQSEFSKNGVKIDAANTAYFLNICGNEKQVLINEIEKLSHYRMEKKVIQKEDIDCLCVKSTEVIIFDLTDSLGARNIKKALSSLTDLLENKEPLPKILIMIAKHFKSLLIAKIATKQGKNVLDELETKSSFAANKYKNQARMFEERELVNMIEKLALLDIDSKIGKIDLQLGLEKWICEAKN